ncbi:MAG: polysaccharide biosynthesis tyrosine autokinase [Undibacterium sp.]|nr:polysaccharide biosynthesis tyrosine autokinase [Opitutaceae bacterium]
MAEASKNNPPSPPPPAEEDAVERRTLRDYYIILRERLWIALPLALIVSISMGYYQSREIPMYSATATMQFEKPDSIVTAQGVVDQTVRSDIDLNTNLQVFNSQRMRTRVAESFTPDQIKILHRPALKKVLPGQTVPTPQRADGLMGGVSIDSIRNSLLISITVRHEDPEAAALVANAYVEQFMKYLQAILGGKNDDALSFLRERAATLEKESKADEDKLQAYMRANNLISLDKSSDMVTTGMMAINTNLTNARLAVLNLENLAQQIETYRKENKKILEVSAISTRPAVASLRTQLNDLQQKQSLLAERYLERHPKLIDVANNIAVTQEHLDQAIVDAIADIAAGLAEARQTVKTLESEYAKQEQQALRLRELRVDFDALQNRANASKTNYLTILGRLNETATTKALESIPLHPLDRATVPGSPYSPNIQRITRSAIGLGVIVFIGVALALSFIDDRVKSSWDVESFIGVNLLGIIPNLNTIKEEDRYSLVLDGSQAPGVEAFLSVYSSAKIHSKLDFPKSVLITSTIPGEGKTLISCNFAGSFARHGKRTLLIDCDLRRPMLHRHFKQQNNAGLIPWFEAGGNLDADLTRDVNLGIIKVGDNLSLLTSGGRSKSPTELLENPLFGQLLERLKKHYDLVVVDSPPMGAVTDSLLIAERIDEVVYVCRFNRAFRKHIKLYIKALHRGKNEVLGIVLNGLSPRRIEYYSNYRYYRSYKKYYGAQS